MRGEIDYDGFGEQTKKDPQYLMKLCVPDRHPDKKVISVIAIGAHSHGELLTVRYDA